MTAFGIGIIGCGNIFPTYINLMPVFAGMEVRAVADIDSGKARRRSEEFGVPALSPDDLMASDDIDVIVNLTVPDAHYRVSRQILEAGKHVYSEKPLVLRLEDGRELQRLAKERDLRIGSAPDTFLGAPHQQARACIDDGRIGEITAGTAHVMSRGMEHWHPNPDFFFLPGGGPVLDIGPYYVTNLIQLAGPVRRVAALSTMPRPTRTISADCPRKGEDIPVRTPTNIHALLDFRSGASVTLSASWDVWSHRHSCMEIYGSEGSLFIPDPNFFGGKLEFAGKDGVVKEISARDHPLGKPNQFQSSSNGLSNYRSAGLADMVQAIRNNRPHRCSFDLALHAVDVMTSILNAGEAEAWIELSTDCSRPEPLGSHEAWKLLAPG